MLRARLFASGVVLIMSGCAAAPPQHSSWIVAFTGQAIGFPWTGKGCVSKWIDRAAGHGKKLCWQFSRRVGMYDEYEYVVQCEKDGRIDDIESGVILYDGADRMLYADGDFLVELTRDPEAVLKRRSY